MVTKWYPGDLPGASREPVGTIFEPQRRSMKDLERPGDIPESILGPGRAQSVPRRDPKIDPKCTCWGKNGCRSRVLTVFA